VKRGQRKGERGTYKEEVVVRGKDDYKEGSPKKKGINEISDNRSRGGLKVRKECKGHCMRHLSFKGMKSLWGALQEGKKRGRI